MKILNKTVSCSLAVLLMLSCSATAFADSKASDKEEVIYAVTDNDGKVNSVYAVNSFTDKNIIDYGNYSQVKNLNTTDKLSYSDDKITATSNGKNLYYQGTMKNAELPWTISIKYYLDNAEISASSLAGKSGKLKIKLSIGKNEKCTSDFYKSYAVMTTVKLDTTLAENIKAEDATIANVGEIKQLSYTMLPNKTLDTEISCDVTNFEMDAVSINGVKMKLDIAVDTSSINSKVTKLDNAADKLSDGAADVSNGSAKISDGAKTLYDGADKLSAGAKTLDIGMKNLQSGMTELNSGFKELESRSSTLTSGSSEVKKALEKLSSSLSTVEQNTSKLAAITKASAQIKSGITKLYQGAKALQENVSYAQYKAQCLQSGLDIEALQKANETTVAALKSQIATLQQTLKKIQGVAGYEEQCKQLEVQITSLSNTAKLISGNSGAITATQKYINGVSEKISLLYKGLGELSASYTKFDKGVTELASSVSTMLVNMQVLSNSIDTLYKSYTKLDSGICEYTSGVSKLFSGYKKLEAGAGKLVGGSKELATGSGDLADGADTLYKSTVTLSSGSKTLSDGAKKLRNETSGINKKIDKEVDSMISAVSGGDKETKSFVSAKNSNCESVQFVIKTEAIEIEEAKKAVAKEEELSWWQKLLRLFGLY